MLSPSWRRVLEGPTMHIGSKLSVLAAGLALILSNSAQALVFVASGPGSPTVTEPTANSATLNYGVNGFGPFTFTITGTATTTGTQTFDYTSGGFYSFFNVRASANAFSNGATTSLYSHGPANCCSSPSNGFSYTGSVDLNLVAGQAYGFSVTGSNSDSARRIQGNFAVSTPVSAAPEPATWAMMMVGFGLVGAMSRRRSQALSA